MALQGPQLRSTRADDTVARALRLAQLIEELLENAPSSPSPDARRDHSTRIARAMAASLVDELEGLVRGARKTDIATG
jgi:hypothetical protein